MRTGPRIEPRYPIVTTQPRAVPVPAARVLPAALNVMGATGPSEIPMTASAAMVAGTTCASSPTVRLAAAMSPAARTRRFGPKREDSRSATRRERVIPAEKATNPSPATPAVASSPSRR